MTSSNLGIDARFIVADQLGPFQLAEDGSRLFLSFICYDSATAWISLPTDCLKSLIMTFPQIMRRALQIRRGDESFRLVYPAKDIRIEQSSDPRTLIVTFATADGFEISLGITPRQLECFNQAASEVECEDAVGRIVTDIN